MARGVRLVIKSSSSAGFLSHSMTLRPHARLLPHMSSRMMHVAGAAPPGRLVAVSSGWLEKKSPKPLSSRPPRALDAWSWTSVQAGTCSSVTTYPSGRCGSARTRATPVNLRKLYDITLTWRNMLHAREGRIGCPSADSSPISLLRVLSVG